MATPANPKMAQQPELKNVALHFDLESVSSDGSYDFADDNVPDVTNDEDVRSESSPPGDGDVDSILSDESIPISNDYVETTDKKATDSTEFKSMADEMPDSDEFDSLDADAQLSKIRPQLQGHCEQMLELFECAPSLANARTNILIKKQLREYSRAIAAMFGDDISALKDLIHVRGNEYTQLRTLLVNERASARNEKFKLQERLRQTITQHDVAIQRKEAEIQKKLTELTEALSRARSQEQRAHKAHSDVATALQDADRQREMLIQKHEAEMAALETSYGQALISLRQDKKANISFKGRENEKKDREINELHEKMEMMARDDEEELLDTRAVYEVKLHQKEKEQHKYAEILEHAITEHQQKHENYCVALQEKHESLIAQKNREIADLKAKAEKTSHSESLQDAGLDRISSLDAELFAVTTKADAYRKNKEAEVSLLKSQNKVLAVLVGQQRQAEGDIKHLQNALSAHRGVPTKNLLGETAVKTAATMLAVHPITSHATSEKKIQIDSDKELFESRRQVAELSHINDMLSHELERYKDCNNGQRVVVDTLKEQLSSVGAKNKEYERKVELIREKLLEKEVELREEFEQVQFKAETFEIEAEAAKAKIAELESDGNGVAVEYFTLLEKSKALEALCAVQEKEKTSMHKMVTDFFSRLCEVKDDHDSVAEILNTYADNVISGEQPDIQGEWDAVLSEIDRVLQEPYNLLAQFVEKLNEYSEVEVDENGAEIDKCRAYANETSKKIQELESDNSILEAKKDAAVWNVKELREQLDKATADANEVAKKVEKLESDNSFLSSGYKYLLTKHNELAAYNIEYKKGIDQLDGKTEELLKEAYKMEKDLQTANREAREAVDEIGTFVTIREENCKMKTRIEYLEKRKTFYKDQIVNFNKGLGPEIKARVADIQLKNMQLLGEGRNLREELQIADQDIKDLQMVVFHVEQRAGVAEDELRGIGLDVEVYRKKENFQGTSTAVINKVTGRGAREAVDELLWLRDLDEREIRYEIEQRKEAEERLDSMVKDVEEILLSVGY